MTEFDSIGVKPFASPRGWPCVRIESVLRPVRRTVSPEWLADREVFHYSIPAIEETGDGRQENGSHIDSAKLLLHGGEVLISKLNPRKGRVLVTSPRTAPIVASSEFIVLEPREVEANYIRYLLLSEGIRQFLSSAVQSVTKSHQRVEPATLTKAWVALPELAEQRAIADFLYRETAAIDRLIAAKFRLLVVLSEQRKAMICAAVTSGLESEVGLRDSGISWLRKIPEHWSTKRAKWLFQERDERSVTGDEVLLSLRQEQGLVRHNDVSEKESRPEELVGYKKVSVGEIVINRMRASTGLVAIAFEDGLVSPDYAVFRVDPAADAEFYTLLFKTELLQAVFRSQSTGLGTGSSGFLRLYSENFLSLWLPYPSLPEQQAIVSQLRRRTSTIDSLVATTERSIALLKERRSSLISAAVTGQIDVRKFRPQEADALCR